MLKAVRRSAPPLLLVAALGALTSCGIPTTGVVEAGGPAGGVVPRTRVYFVWDGALIDVSRETATPGDVETAVRLLLQGPTRKEMTGGLATLLPTPLSTAVPAAPDPNGPTQAAQEAGTPDSVKVTAREDRVTIELSAPVGKLSDLAAAQVICTAVAAQRVADPGSPPAPVTVTVPAGRRVEGTGADCPDG
ncbi:hypothetical protein OG562_33085 [Streptomyces sp. NBC_01275]|uniref:hypothetical protein n=1 Tax=Streptomyces sp. NBC_01275 TaxID=2903807 RepID=UPI00224C80F4|nr:hypothetical protein [Streptomyces sp. NBC_01275]MCX4765730.1 hypothetical protein [Streptomyces sp. NBC_01275]